MGSPRTTPGGQFALAPLIVLLGGCAFVYPRFSQEVAASFARDEMRRMETPFAEIYYPARGRAAAERTASRIGECLTALRQLPKTQTNRGKPLVFITSANFNNAYVTGYYFGEPLHTVEPLHMTQESFHWLNLGTTDIGAVACHELVHYVQLEQDDGLWGGLNRFFGKVLSSQASTERWFLEGIAQYYEGRLGKKVGRPSSAFYRGVFESGVAARGGKLVPGDLSGFKRELSLFGGPYLTGMHFVEYVARTYGEDKLWELIELQGHAVAPPLAVTLRFRQVYGKSIGALLEDYSHELESSLRPRLRPDSQRVLDPDLGYLARLAGSPADGSMAALSAGTDRVVQLAVFEHDGSVRFSRPLTRLIPGRPWISVHPLQVSGLSFTADGRWLYLMNDDLQSDGASQGQLWKVDARDGEVTQRWEGLRGFGGSVSPDGSRYVFVEVRGDTSNLIELELGTGAQKALTALPGPTTLGAPAYSPDGTRVAFSRRGERGFDLYLREDNGALSRLTHDGAFNYSPRWVDDRRLLFVREREGRVQAHTLELASGAIAPTSNAPFVVLDPVPIGGGDFAFANRDGWSWSLDAAPIEPTPPPQPGDRGAGAPDAPPGPAAPPLRLESDHPYSTLDHLFIPTLHAPLILLVPSVDESGPVRRLRLGQRYGLSLRGQDRLGFHQWALNGLVSMPEAESAFSFEYGNQLLAPWFARLRLEREQTQDETTYAGSLGVSRAWWTTPVSLSVSAVDVTRAPSASEAGRHLWLVGPGVSFDYFARESTPYGGVKRALGLNGGVRFYPAPLGSDFAMSDLRAEAALAPHLPLLARHSLLATARGRMLWGAPAGLLQVGGVARGDFAAANRSRTGEPVPDPFLPTFAEAVRGYEDHSVRATRVATGTARYLYPFIIDHGWASTLYLLPSLFIRQVDLEIFGALAYTDNPTSAVLRAAGGAVLVRAAFSSQPFSLYYQVAARFDERLGPLHLVGLVFE